MMTGSQALPSVFAHLDQHANPAVDMALWQALPHLSAPADEAAIDLLVKRMRKPVVVSLIGHFTHMEHRLQSLLLNRVHDLTPAIRQAMGSADINQRLGAIEIIRQSQDFSLAYLLGEAIRARCEQTHKLAALSLYEMTARWLDVATHPESLNDSSHRTRCQQALCEGLRTALNRWDHHRQRNVLEAALWMGDALKDDIASLASDPRHPVLHAMRGILKTSTDTRLAGFALQALAVTPLKDAAVTSISQANDPTFAAAILDNTWRLADPRIQRAFRKVNLTPWLMGAAPLLDSLDESQLTNFVRRLKDSGGTGQDKFDHLRLLLASDSDVVREAAIWEIISDQSDKATSLLETMTSRRRDRVASLALRELQRRDPEFKVQTAIVGQTGGEAGHERDRVQAAWHQLAQDLDAGIESMRVCHGAHKSTVFMFLRAKSASSRTPDRVKLLQVVLALDLIPDMQEQVYSLSYDPDVFVRASAISMLPWLPGVISERILRAALNDPDDRVVANAIEALEELGALGLELENQTEEKLSSPSARVRANAIKSLIRSENKQAAESLLEMLSHPSQAYRLSALWVVERSNLRSILNDVVHMSQNDPDDRVRRRAQRLLRGWGGAFADSDDMFSLEHLFASHAGGES